MLQKDILCATDLTPASDLAVKAAHAIAAHLGTRVTLLHVMDGKEQREQVLSRMHHQVAQAGPDRDTTYQLMDGHFMKRIAEASAQDHSLLVLATHGVHGLRQSLFGADILKLVRHAATPSLVVQEGTPIDRLMERIVLPVAGHQAIAPLLDAVVSLARAYSAEVHIYQLMRPGESPSEELLSNKSRMLERLEQEGIPHREVNEPSTSFSVGFAEPTIRYAKRVDAGAIAIMAHASDEYRHMADAEKERILTNDAGIAVLCA